ncbi:hypothetical protein [Kineococcus sp. R86509]|uniref:hypothetical protein n=1 Tax=Kineococcus sp. R86509 TaxID=3093851 RepID=UPI0036D23372
MDEKITAGLAGTGVTAGGIGLIASTATGPGFFAAAAGWLVAVAGYGVALAKLVVCLELNGQPEMAQVIREKVQALEREIQAFKDWAVSLGVPL